MNWTWITIIALVFLLVLLLIWRPKRKKRMLDTAEELPEGRPMREASRIPIARDPLDGSSLGERTEDIPVRISSGKIISIRVNKVNADIVKESGLGAFPNFRHNLEQYGRRHRNYYRRYFQPEQYYILGGGFDFDPITWWIYFDLFFGYDADNPAYDYDPQASPDMQQEYQEKYSDCLQSLPEQDDPAGLRAYLQTEPGHQEDFVSHLQPREDTIGEPDAKPQQEEDPAGLRDYISRGPAEVQQDKPTDIGEDFNSIHEEPVSSAPESVHEETVETVSYESDSSSGGGED